MQRRLFPENPVVDGGINRYLHGNKWEKYPLLTIDIPAKYSGKDRFLHYPPDISKARS